MSARESPITTVNEVRSHMRLAHKHAPYFVANGAPAHNAKAMRAPETV
ncbi:hypothetical protein [Burkholderia pyrrocinia]|nr:hypothetical protein [Burkholderia pyrrocinia]